MFYWLFRSRNDKVNDPLVIWLTGGPGCSSELALFYENGPYTINPDLSLKQNPSSWNSFSNLLYVDQPLGTGYSKAKDPTHYARNEEMVATYFYKFLHGFIFEKYPEFKGRALYITGESYAGHYIPAIAEFMLRKDFKEPELNLQGVAIGNGLVSPYMQYPEYNTFAYENKLIGYAQYTALKGAFAACQMLIKTRLWFVALYACQLSVTSILGSPVAPKFNVYDIRRKCDNPPLCYDFGLLDKFLARHDVIEELKVKNRSWTQCNMMVHTMMLGDWMLDLEPQMQTILDSGVRVLVYSGDKDFICNWRGGEAWTLDVKWLGKDDFGKEQYKDWMVESKKVGEFKNFQNLTFIRVFDAGHMVPMDQPSTSLYLLDHFIGKQVVFKK
jgi:carboxypeptidase C (cathepsin A)